MRRVLAWTFRGLAGLVGLAMLAVIFVLVALGTRWGKSVVKGQVERALDGWLQGDVAIGRMEGDLFGDLVLSDVVVRRRDGVEVIRIPRVEVDYSLLELRDRTLRIHELILEAPVVTATQRPDGAWDLARLIPVKEEKTPLGWDIVVERAAVRGGLVAVRPLGSVGIHLAGLEITMALEMDDEQIAVTLERAGAMWLERLLPAELGGRVALADDGLTVDVDGLVAGAPWSLDGGLRPAPLAGSARLRVAQLRPAALVPRAGWVAQIDEVAVDATLIGDVVIAHARARAEGAELASSALLGLDPVVVRWGKVAGAVPGIERWAGELAPVRGDLLVDATFHGAPDDLAVTGTVRGTRVGWAQAGARRLVATVDVRGLPARPTGTAHVRADDVRQGATKIGFVEATTRFRDQARHLDVAVDTGGPGVPYALTARAAVDRGGGTTRIRIGDFQVRTRQLMWDGSGATVTLTPSGEIQLAGVDLTSRAGRIAASGELGRAGDRLDVTLRGVLLEELRQAFAPGAAEVKGQIDGHVVVVRRNRRLSELTAKIAVTRLELRPDAAPLRLDIDVGLLGRNLRGAITVEGGRIGTVGLDVETRAPVDPMDPRQWVRLDEKDVKKLELRLQRIDLAEVGRLAKVDSPIAGIVDGTVALGPELASVRADVTATHLGVPRVPRTLDVRVLATLTRDRLTAKLTSTVDAQSLLEAEVTVAAGLRALMGGDLDSFRHAAATGEAKLEDFPLGAVRQSFGLPVDLQGLIDLRAHAHGTIDDPSFDVKVGLAPGARLQHVVFSRLDAGVKLDRTQLTARLDATQQAGGTITGDLAMNPANPRVGKLRVQAHQLDLSFLSILEARTGFGVRKGRLDADVHLEGTAQGRFAEGRILVTGGDVRLTEMVSRFTDLKLEASLDRASHIEVAADAKTGSSGAISVRGTASLVGLAPGPAKGTFSTRDLTVSTGRTTIEIDARGTFLGKPGEDAYILEVTPARGAIRIPRRLGGDQLHDTGPLEDVVYLDAKGREAKAPKLRTNPLVRVRMQVNQPILVTSREVRADVTGNLEVEVHPSDNVIRGRVRVDRGFLELFGQRWTLNTSNVVWNGEVPMNPRLDIHLTREFRTTTVGIDLGGRLEQPDLKLTSEGGEYDQSQLLGFVLGGSPDDNPGPSGDADVTQQAIDAASGLVFGQLRPMLQQIVPIDVLSVKRKSGATEETLVTVGKWISANLFLGYRHRFAGERAETDNDNEGTLEWYFLKRWRLELVGGDRGEGSVDVLWINRW